MKRLGLVAHPTPIEQKYTQAIDEIQRRIIENPLFEKNLETPRDASILLDKIVRFFYYENTDYLTEDIDFKNLILEALSELHAFLSKSGLDSIFRMYANFETSGEITSNIIYEKSKELFATIGKNDLPMFLSILFSPFETLAGYREENTHGSKKLQEFSAYGKILGRGLLYPEHRVAGITRPAPGIAALTSLLCKEPEVSTIIGKISFEVHGVTSGSSLAPGSNIIPLSGSISTGKIIRLVPNRIGKGLEKNAEVVEESKTTSNNPESENLDVGEDKPSEAVIGRIRRRENDREIRIGKEENREQQKNQEWYVTELEKLRGLRTFLHQRFEELRNHLLEHVPYVEEVLNYIRLIDRLNEKGYEVKSLGVSGVREEVSRKISDYENLISQLNKINIKLLQDITSLQDSLPSATELEQKKLSRRLVKLQSKLDRGIRDVTAYEREVVVRKTEAQELFSHIVGYRLPTLPNREQFSLAFHHSLKAEELYSAPDFIPETPVTHEWIDANVIPLFVSILGTHLHEYHGVNIRDLYELMGKIDELPEIHNNEVRLPDTDGITQKKVSDFFTMLIPIIPNEYLTELPNLPTIITPEGISPEVLSKVKLPKVKKTHREIRKAVSFKKARIEKERKALIEKLHSIEESLKEYERYWKERLKQNLRTRSRYIADIEKLDSQVRMSIGRPTKTKDELEKLIDASNTEVENTQMLIHEGGLNTDEIGYKKLLDERSRMSGKVKRVK